MAQIFDGAFLPGISICALREPNARKLNDGRVLFLSSSPDLAFDVS